MIEESPWTFNQNQLIFHHLKHGEDPRAVHLYKLDLWVQIYDLKIGFMSDRVVKDIANYIGELVETDPKNLIGA